MSDAGRPRFSIITVANGSASELVTTRASLSGQSIVDWEHIVVVPRSRDDLQAVVATWSPRPTIAEDLGQGPFHAMNLGYRLSTGHIINFMNSGDRFANPDVLKTVSQIIDEETAWCVGGSVLRGRSVKAQRPAPKRRVEHRSIAYFRIPMCHQSTYISSDFFATIGTYREDLPIVADYEWALRATQQQAPRTITDVLAVVEPGGISQVKPARTVWFSHQARMLNAPGIGNGFRSLAFMPMHWLRWTVGRTVGGRYRGIGFGHGGNS